MSEIQNMLNIKLDQNNKSHHIQEEQAPPGPMNIQNNVININGNQLDKNNVKDQNLPIAYYSSQQSIIKNQYSNNININNYNKPNLISTNNSNNTTPNDIPFTKDPSIYPQLINQENNQEGNNNLIDEQNDRSIDDRICCLCCGTSFGTICIYIVVIFVLFLNAIKY